MANLSVILAARKEKQSEIPFPLLPYQENLCLIDRTLGILKEVGVRRIILVVGFCAEMFDKYADENIKLVKVDNYEFSASMASLAAVQDYIDEDFLLIEGDTFFEKKVLDHLINIEQGNLLVATEESGSGDECYIESQSGFITKISKDRHRICNYEGELLGVSRISLDTYRRMLDLWNRSTNSYLNYEYVLMDVTTPLDRPYIFFKNLIWGDVDCPLDFKKLKEVTNRILRRKEDPFDQENLLHHLSEIFPDKDVSTAEIIQIGGLSNKNFRINFEGKSYVLRVPGPGSEGMVERCNEEFNAIEGWKMGVNPQIRYFNSKTGVKLADYIHNAETLNCATIQRHDNLRKIADIYKQIHGACVRLKNDFNVFKEIEKYDTLIAALGGQMYEGWKEFKPLVMELESRINNLGVEICPCHNDAVPENFIKAEDGTIYLIDWEYSGMNDPMADFAALFIESDFSKETRSYFLTQYYDGEIPANTEEHILCYEILWDSLWAQWTVIKEVCGESYGSYGINRYNRSKSKMKLLVDNYIK